MRKIRLITILLILLSFNFAGSIKGIVTSTETNKPLPGVNIFLSGSTMGAASAKDGSYLIKSIPAGKYTIVISMVGYERKTFDVMVSKNTTIELNVNLKEKIYKTDDVKVTALTPENWQRAYELFVKHFFGDNEYADDCIIHNKEVLNFTFEYGVVTAKTDSVLRVTNKALGYDINIEFEKFVYNSLKRIVLFNVHPHFTELNLAGKELEKAVKNRREVYLGSFKHLLAEMAANDSSKFSFSLYKTPHLKKHYTDWYEKKLSDFHSSFFEDSTFYIIESDSSFMAYFDDGVIEKEGIILSRAPKLVFDNYGNILNGENFIAFGDWKEQRFSMQLPRNFKIDLFEEKK